MTNKPSGIDERPEQFRPPVVKVEGVTESERYLAKLADKSFLNLWSYPSPFRDQKHDGKGDGKELCDLLVICGQHIIIFSDKMNEWPNGDLNTAWCRWAKSLKKSAAQTKGAERWITKFPERIFLDRECTVPFPIDFPPSEEKIVHRVLVAGGATSACRKHLGEGSGSMIVKPAILEDAHWSNKNGDVHPFSIGDLDPAGSFVHVFDEVALDLVLAELDTVRDFTDYLEKRQAFIRSGELLEAHGEENLMAFYAVRINADGDHDFVCDDKATPIVIDRHHYQNFIANPRYIAKKRDDEISYLWDKLIEAFTNHMLDGTSITLDGYEFDLRKNELGVRYMALQRRFIRRAHGEAVRGALLKGKDHDCFFRVMFSKPESKESETAFFIQTFKYLDWMEELGGYEKYRQKRNERALVYAQGLLERYSHLERVIGFSREPPDQGRGISEDLIYAEQTEWTEEDRLMIKQECKTYNVLQGEIKEYSWGGQEFPDIETIAIERKAIHTTSDGMNRNQRRAMRAKLGRKKKR